MAKWSGVVREGTDAKGSFTPNIREGQGSQINSNHAGFRARKDAMHAMDGSDMDIHNGTEKKASGRYNNEEKESLDEGTKVERGLADKERD